MHHDLHAAKRRRDPDEHPLDPPGKPLFPVVPSLLYGVDLTELSEVHAREFYARKAGQPLDEAELSQLFEEAGRRSTERSPP